MKPSARVKTYTSSVTAANALHSASLCVWQSRFAISLVLLISVLLPGCNMHPSLSDEVRNLTLKTLTGQDVVLAEASGPMLVSFWATDCAICVHEMPEMVALYDNYRAKGFELVAVAMPYDPPNRVLEMAEQEQWPFPVALDINGEAVDAFATVKGTPTNYLIDKNGRLIKRYVGAVPFDDLQSRLDSLLGLS
ncbi:MAG: TlpA disulfide reductase family protein [Granulosicoccus sp.]